MVGFGSGCPFWFNSWQAIVSKMKMSTNEKRLLYEIIQQIQFLNRYNVTAHTIWRVSYH